MCNLIVRIQLLALLLLPVSALAADYVEPLSQLEAAAKPVNCKEERLLLQDRILCQRPALRKKEHNVYQLFQQLLAAYKGRERLAFAAGQGYWNGGQRAGCDSHAANYRDEIAACESEQFDRRATLLERLKADPALLLSTVADYKFVDPWYVKLFPKQYEGKVIEFNAQLLDTSPVCEHPKTSLKGRFAPVEDEIDTVFKSVDEQLIFHCQAPAYMNWKGTVKLDKQGKPYLYITEVEGSPLP